MLSLQITSLKHFMNQLLVSGDFDSFLLEEATISTSNTYTIDGHINRDFYPPEERNTDSLPYEFQPWSEIKGLCFDLIKGKHTPLYFKFVLYLKPEAAATLLQKEQPDRDASSLKALVLNIRYDGTKATITTGTSYHTFVLDKEIENLWDKTVMRFFDQKQISYELL